MITFNQNFLEINIAYLVLVETLKNKKLFCKEFILIQQSMIY